MGQLIKIMGGWFMIVRNMGGEFLPIKNEELTMNNGYMLLEFLGIKKDAIGVQKVSVDVELIASVPFQMKSEELTMKNGQEGVAWVLSTFDLDRFGERVDPFGWDFSRFLCNPVVEWAHRGDIPAIGKIEGLAVDETGLHGFVVFNDKAFDPFGWSIGERVRAGVIRAGSVGFRVLEIEIPSKEDSRDGTSLIFRKQELLEFSICNVPANPFALVKQMKNEERTIVPSFWGGVIRIKN